MTVLLNAVGNSIIIFTWSSVLFSLTWKKTAIVWLDYTHPQWKYIVAIKELKKKNYVLKVFYFG